MKHIIIKKWLLPVLTFAISTFIFTACTEKSEKKEERQQYVIPDSLLKTLKIDTVKTCPLVDALTLTGTVDFNQDKQVNIYPLVSGNVEDVKVQLGDYVQKGQTLAIIKSSEMAGYSNSLINAQTNLAVAKKNLDAQNDLFKSGLASQLDVNSAEAAYQQAVAQLEMVERILKINSNNTQGNYIIKAPISGFIVQKNVTNNTAIRTDNGNNLFTISDLKDVWIYANVYESNISKIHLGDPVDVTTISYPNRIFKGRVDKMMNVLDPTNKVMKVKVVLPNADYALKPQMFASILVTNKENKQAICISSKALVFDNSRYYVLKYQGNGIAIITPVEIINTIGDKTYIASGIEVGDQIIASQAILIYDTLNN
ncbi:MAG: efflux RND transporter periplasmic adaptor subunit [Bacteroidota bacterium]|jgi:cobalt-zinc-cadmium efflux system membrane fusion protein|nr:efflux RND transporter periplasmic adaptor subunit [Bacteroidota bacterium]